MTAPSTPPGERNLRGLGWDLDSSYSSNRGELLPLGSFGHTGFTGTSIWIDPATKGFVVFLSNRVHPDGRGDVTPLRAQIATVAATALERCRRRGRRRPDVATAAAGRSARARRRRRPGRPPRPGADRHRRAARRRLRAAEGPARRPRHQPHRHRPRRDRRPSTSSSSRRASRWSRCSAPSTASAARSTTKVPTARTRRPACPSTASTARRGAPTAAMLAGIDTLVFDIQDIGCRFYTYMSHDGLLPGGRGQARQTALRRARPPQPDRRRGASKGPLPTRRALGFAGLHAMPLRHGLTVGELAQLFNAERKMRRDLTVVAMRRLAARSLWFDQTGLPWINPSPNMRSLTQATAVSGHRPARRRATSPSAAAPTRRSSCSARRTSTASPLAATLNARRLPGIALHPVRFTPGLEQVCEGAPAAGSS